MKKLIGLRVAVAGLVCLAVAGATGWSLGSRPAQPATEATRPEEADSLSRYLEPVGPAPRLDDYAAFLPAAPPAPLEHGPPARAAEPPATTWELGAILNDESVAEGGRLSDGSVVLEIERDHVVIRAPNGALRRLVLSAG